MSDLDAEIRSRLGVAQDLEAMGDPVTALTYSVLVDTIEAVLDLHADGEVHSCPAEIEGYSVQRWHDAGDPCPTKRAIAEKLGVEVDA